MKWLLEKRECYRLTKTGVVLFLSLLLIFLILLVDWLPRYLAVDAPLDKADILVVEGWVSDSQLEETKNIFDGSDYQLLITTGSIISRGSFLSEYESWAGLAKASLLAMGVSDSRVVSVPTPDIAIERTFHSAKALAQYLAATEFRSLNIVTSGMHARRTWWIFQSVLGDKYKVGIISIDTAAYNSKEWWKYSKGARDVVSETIKYSHSRMVSIVE